jgi:hypothetical protein
VTTAQDNVHLPRETLMRLPSSLIALPFMAGAVLTGCASSEPAPTPVAHENPFLGTEPVYAVLKARSDGQWTFTQVSRSNNEPEEGYLVRLNEAQKQQQLATYQRANAACLEGRGYVLK